jgi:cytochrome c biogenesis protein CcdA
VGPALYLASGRHPRRDVLQFTLGVLGVYLFGGVLILLGPGEALLALVPHPSATTRYILETIAGGVMLVAGPVVWRARRRLVSRQRNGDATPRGAGRSPALLGVTITLVELPTAFPYFAAIAAIVGSGLGFVQRLVALVVYNGCFVLPLLGILGLLWLDPKRADQILATARAYIRRRWPVLVAGVALLAGAFVLALGVTGLVGQGHGGAARFSRHLRRLISH